MHEFITYGKSDSKNIIIQPADEHDLSLMESEAEEVQRLLKSDDFCILAYPVTDWNKELSPWEAPAVFGKENFGSGAEDTLHIILDRVCNGEGISDLSMPAGRSERVMKGADRKKYYLTGYSLAGLFSLWTAFQTDIFSGVVAASPSMWFPGFITYTKEHQINTPNVYLSLGKKEEKTKKPVMRTVGDCIRQESEILKKQGINTILEWNEGNHFVDSDKRVARGIAWMLGTAG